MYTENKLGTAVRILLATSLMAQTIKLPSAHELSCDATVTSHNPKTKLSFSQPTDWIAECVKRYSGTFCV